MLGAGMAETIDTRLVAGASLESSPAIGREWSQGNLRGWSYGEIRPELAAALQEWAAKGRVENGEELAQGSVFRSGEWVVKFFPPPSLFGWWREARSRRAAERYHELLPIPSPRPLFASRRFANGSCMLVRHFVAGRLLSELWNRDAAACDALPAFLAQMQLRRVLHGDLHPRNLLWTGEHWILLDVDGVRHGLHNPARVKRAQWAQLLLHLGDEDGLRRAHARTLELLRAGHAAESRWRAILRQAERMRRAHQRPRRSSSTA